MRHALVCVALLAAVLTPRPVPAQTLEDRMAGMGQGSPPPVADGPWAPPFMPSPQCFLAGGLTGVVAPDDRDVILRIGRDAFYRVRLSGACPALAQPGAQVLGIGRGASAICRPSDVELKVAAAGGAVSRCGAETLHRMSLAEVKAASAPAPH